MTQCQNSAIVCSDIVSIHFSKGASCTATRRPQKQELYAGKSGYRRKIKCRKKSHRRPGAISSALGDFAPMFAHLNDDVLFGEVWNEKAIDVKTKCIVTVVSLMASGITDSSLSYHLQNAKNNGVTREEIAAIITHAAMYVGWPKGWAVFRLAKEIWNETEPVSAAGSSELSK